MVWAYKKRKMNQVNASHILVKTEEEAKKIMQELKIKSFEQIAREKSLCPSGKNKGSLGWFGRGQMVREFEDACFNGKKGDVKLVKSEFGWHVVKIVDVK